MLRGIMGKKPKRPVLSDAQREVAEQIRGLHESGEALNISAVREKHSDLLLAAYRVKPFWGWKRALEAAALNYSMIRFRLPEYVTCKLCGGKRRNLTQHVLFHHGMPAATYKQRFAGATLISEAALMRRRSERPSTPLQTAPRIIPHWEPVWSPEYVLDRLAELDRQGVGLNPSAIERAEPALYRWTLAFIGKWDTALEAIGLDPARIRLAARKQVWTRQSVIKALCQRRLTRQPLNWLAIVAANRSLSWAALRLFGTYDNALKAAGLDPKKIRRRPVPPNRYRTRHDVIDGILRRKLAELPLNDDALRSAEGKDVALYQKARRMFGSWRAAITAAGYDYEKIRLRGNPYGDAESVVAELRRRHALGMTVTATGVRRGKGRDSALYTRALVFFGTWSDAADAAGIPRQMAHPSRAKYPAEADVLAAIRQRHERDLSLGSRDLCHGDQADVALFMRARRLFGTWGDAVRNAGYSYERVLAGKRKYSTRQAVTAEIKRRRQAGLPVNAQAVLAGSRADSALYANAKREFGGWRQAVEAAGFAYHEISSAARR